MQPINRPLTQQLGLAGSIWTTLVDSACRPDLIRPTSSESLFLFSDYGGMHKKSLIRTYTFVLCGRSEAAQFVAQVRTVRAAHPMFRGEMAYKKIRKPEWQAAMAAYCQAARSLSAQAITFAIDNHKSLKNLYVASPDPQQQDPAWIAAVSEFKSSPPSQVLRITHLAAMLASAFSLPGQDVFWISDNDDIVADDRIGRATTRLYLRNLQRYMPHEPGAIEVHPPDGFKDMPMVGELLSVADLCAGAMAEVINQPMTSEVRIIDAITQNLQDPQPRAHAVLRSLVAGSDCFHHCALRVIHEPPGFVVAHMDLRVS